MKRILFALAALSLTAPAVAQFSPSYNFLKAVRDRDVLKANEAASKFIDTKDFSTGETALHIVTRARDLPWMKQVLSWNAKVDLKDARGNTPLMIAAELDFVEGADLLIRQRANVNVTNSSGETPLIVAVQRRGAAMVRLLLLNGANPDKADASAGLSARDYAARDRRSATILKIIQDTKTTKATAAGPKL